MPVWVIPAALAAGSWLLNAIGQRASEKRQGRINKGLAQFQADANQKNLEQQQDYNSPANQMLRYQQAGLNRNLIYGQGNPGTQSAPLSYPDIKPPDVQNVLGNLGPLLNQTAMTASQVQATDAKTRHTYTLNTLAQLQTRVMEKNPLLDNVGFKAIIDSLVSTAEIKGADATMKSQTADWFSGSKSFNVNGQAMHGPAGVLKLETELKLLEQKFNLGTLDSKIKAEVLSSKEFSNAILEVQKKWMTDAEITPQHVLQFIQLLLMKIL